MDQHERTRLMTRQFSLLLLTTSFFGFAWSTYLILPKFFATELGLDAEAIGRVVAVQGLAAVCVTPIVGRLVDRYGRKPWIVVGNLLLACSGIGFQFIEHLGPLLYSIQILWGMGMVFTFNSAGTLAADFAPAGRLAEAIGLFGAANLGMNAIAPLAGEYLADSLGWTSVFAVSALAAAGSALIGLSLEEPETHEPPPLSLGQKPRPVLGWAMLEVYGATFAMTAAFAALFTLQQPFALEHGVRHVSTFFVGFALVALSVRIFGGRLIDRVGVRRAAIVSIAFYALVPGLLAVLGAHRLFFVGALMGLAHGVAYPAVTALGLQRTDPSSRGMVLSIVHGSFNGGNATFAYLLGALVEQVGFHKAFWVAGAISFVGALLLCGRPLARRALGMSEGVS
jgi:MFS family permease